MKSFFGHLPDHSREDWANLDDDALIELFEQDALDVDHPNGNPAKLSKFDAAWCFGYYVEDDTFVPYVCYSFGVGDTRFAKGEPKGTQREAILEASRHEAMHRGELTEEELYKLGEIA